MKLFHREYKKLNGVSGAKEVMFDNIKTNQKYIPTTTASLNKWDEISTDKERIEMDTT